MLLNKILNSKSLLLAFSSVKKTIKGLDGVKNVEVSLENKNAIVTFYPNLIKADSIQNAVNKGGFTAGKPQEIKQ